MKYSGKRNFNLIKMRNRILDRGTLLRFGIVMGLMCFAISGFLYVKDTYYGALATCLLSVIFIITGLSCPIYLRTTYVLWMRLAHVLEWVTSKIILSILFYIIVTPMALCIRLLQVDLLERKKTQATYWKEKRGEFDPLNYERRF